MYKRKLFKDIVKRLNEPRQFIQVIAGPRQTGKTTLIRQVLEEVGIPHHYAPADDAPDRSKTWLRQQWEVARLKIKTAKSPKGFILVLDEIQKINDWTETVKKNWDDDTWKNVPIKLVILGSAPLLLQQGLTESLGGRFEKIRVSHWPFEEMKDAFGFSLEQFIYFGGYPGAAPLIPDQQRWRNYVKDALIETTISRDVLMMARVDKPALLRQLFEVGSLYSGQILSFTKMIGQLQDAGNTTTLSHYLKLLSGAGMLAGIGIYSGSTVRKKMSIPKYQVLNNALISAQTGKTFEESRANPELWGRFVESAVGAYLLNSTEGTPIKVYYWRDRKQEVDFVLEKGNRLIAIEVKNTRKKEKLPGINSFLSAFPDTRPLLVGTGGLPVVKSRLTPFSNTKSAPISRMRRRFKGKGTVSNSSLFSSKFRSFNS